MSISVSISIDVPDLSLGIEFYCAAFDLSKRSEPVPGVVVLHGLGIEI